MARIEGVDRVLYGIMGLVIVLGSLRPMISGRAVLRGYYAEGLGAHAIGAFFFVFGILLIRQAFKKTKRVTDLE
jgi:hypothetical protein